MCVCRLIDFLAVWFVISFGIVKPIVLHKSTASPALPANAAAPHV